MEHKCEIGGECLRNRDDVVNDDDRISELPEDLLLLILYSLPTETVIATSILSKRWRSLWKNVPKLKFDSANHKSERHKFSEDVLRCLLSHKAPVLESLHLVVRDIFSESSEVGRWIEISSSAQHARKLVVDLHNQQSLYAGFPSVLLASNNTLHTLKLKNHILLDFPCGVSLKSLRKLQLHFVVFNDQESVRQLFLGCPSLEDLLVKRKRNVDAEALTIAVPTLQRLTIESDYLGDPGYMIDAPSLKYLNINKFRGLDCCLIENAPELVEAKIIDVSDINNDNILVSLTAVKRLSLELSPFVIKYPTGIIFYQLLYLELYTRKGWTLLSLILDSCPRLQILKFNNYFAKRKDLPVGCEWSQPTCVPECLLYHLETFVWTRYEWEREDEKKVATYILENARRLKKATISTRPMHTEELKMLETIREQMLNQVASNSCHLVIECDTFSCN